MTKLTFTNRGSNILGATAQITADCTGNRSRTFNVLVRIVESADGSCRVDMKTGISPWEAIDDGKPSKNARKAQTLARRWVRRANKQRTLQPVQLRPTFMVEFDN